ncbi:ABC transporter ATP-binding protein [Rhodococcus sp. G-MC3]|uniref:ABC transporter ATP-binding protein n=1 Tax=Rhodococcus sp. G-MC3 TaxID=3046209 RepID=UPI0024B8AD47|nr:ABC transporter ATP-binding protein [Rhodococcus sp. G-MC3]MDJ0394620.1 ABC transporter ATP-binding protein [Rhodococcus sp. G-MC3]
MAIDVSELSKTFGKATALDGLELHVGAGEVHGFLGPNGAGKSTTIRILLGLIRATSGHVQLLGGDPWRDAVALHRRLAYVPGDVTLWPQLTGGEVVDLLARMRGGIDPARRGELIERFELDPTKKTRTYSRGNRQKVALVSAFASNADVLLLDEPTTGLDPLKEQVFAGCVTDAVARGATVLLSSHILSEVDKLCDRVTIIRDGRTVDSGALADMRHLTHSTVTAVLERPLVDPGSLPGEVTVDGHSVTCRTTSADLPVLMHLLADGGITSLVSSPPTLEDLFLKYYASSTSAHQP